MTSLLKFEAKQATVSTPFEKIAGGIDVGTLLIDVLRNPQLWNKNPCRLSKRTPHHETQDMILRYRDESAFIAGMAPWSTFCDEHVADWNKTIEFLPAARKVIFDLFSFMKGEILGGVFIYKMQPGTKIFAHKDTGWHPEFYFLYCTNFPANIAAFLWNQSLK